jgi:hypothetical protein
MALQKRKQNCFLFLFLQKNSSLALPFCKNETWVSQRDWNRCTGMTHANDKMASLERAAVVCGRCYYSMVAANVTLNNLPKDTC